MTILRSNPDAIVDLYSPDIREREKASARYCVFPEFQSQVPVNWSELLGRRGLNDGIAWPESLRSLVTPEAWPKHAFGTANAACLVIWHRPGKSKNMDHQAGAYIGPHTPVLGGIGHAHNVLWHSLHPNRSWYNIHKFIPEALGDSLRNPWSQVMLVCLNPIPGEIGREDKYANIQAVAPDGRLDSIVTVCRPLLVLACGKPVCEAIRKWSNPTNVPILCTSHPLKWNGHGGVYDGPEVVKALRTELSLGS